MFQLVLRYTSFRLRLHGPIYDMMEKRWIRLQLHGAIYRPDSFVLMQRYCANLKVKRYESMSLNRIVADKSHRVIVALAIHSEAFPYLSNNKTVI